MAAEGKREPREKGERREEVARTTARYFFRRACQMADLDCAQSVSRKYGMNILNEPFDGTTALHECCRSTTGGVGGERPQQIAELIIAADASGVAVKDKNGCFPLHYAVLGRAGGLVKLLMERMPPETLLEKNEAGHSIALAAFSANSMSDTVGIDIRGLSSNVHMAAMVSAAQAMPFHILTHVTSEGCPAHQAVSYGGELTTAVLDRFAPDFDFLTLRDRAGRTLLHTACMTGDVDAVNAVLERATPALLVSLDSNNMTPLNCAANSDKPAAAALAVLERIPDESVLIQNSSGNHALHYANTELAAAILERVPDHDLLKRNSDGETALHVLCGTRSSANFPVVKELIARMPTEELYHQDSSGCTPLSSACWAGRFDIAERLLAVVPEESITLVDDMGNNCLLDIAKRFTMDRLPLLHLLAASTPAAGRAARDSVGYTAADILESKGFPDAAALVAPLVKSAAN